nr:60s ribosomal protein l35-1 [Quercus suber]
MSMDAFEKKKFSDKVIWLARYPNNEAKQFKCSVINGLKFCTKDSKATRKTQNKEVCDVTEVVVKTKPREVFDVGINASHDDNGDDEVGTYLENVPYNITTDNACDDANDSHAWARLLHDWLTKKTRVIRMRLTKCQASLKTELEKKKEMYFPMRKYAIKERLSKLEAALSNEKGAKNEDHLKLISELFSQSLKRLMQSWFQNEQRRKSLLWKMQNSNIV